MPALVLASTSRYRRELLQRLRLPFEARAPEVDEARLPGESVAAMTRRLAAAKAEAVARLQPQAWVLGSDQAAELDGEPLGKPGNAEVARAQLARMSGRTLRFHTAVCLCRAGDAGWTESDLTEVAVRALQPEEIGRYVEAEKPFDCAGSFRAEGLGIALFDAIRSDDPSALIGLPLIATAALLRRAGFALP